MPKKKSKSKKYAASDILAIIGGIVAIIDGILTILGSTILQLVNFSIPSLERVASGTIGGAILLVVGLIILASTGLISGFAVKVKTSWLVYLIFAIITYVFGSSLAALLLILAAIIAFFKY